MRSAKSQKAESGWPCRADYAMLLCWTTVWYVTACWPSLNDYLPRCASTHEQETNGLLISYWCLYIELLITCFCLLVYYLIVPLTQLQEHTTWSKVTYDVRSISPYCHQPHTRVTDSNGAHGVPEPLCHWRWHVLDLEEVKVSGVLIVWWQWTIINMGNVLVIFNLISLKILFYM